MQSKITIKRGINIRLIGKAEMTLHSFESGFHAIMPTDFLFLSPKLLIKEGDSVKIGTPLFCDKEQESIHLVAPVSGTIMEIRRGEKRRIEAIIIQNDKLYEAEEIQIPVQPNREEIVDTLLRSGLWPMIRRRPFDAIANPQEKPRDIFISGFDSAPLAPDFRFIIQDKQKEFQRGLSIIRQLTEGKIYLSLPYGEDYSIFENIEHIELQYIKGPHPAGNIGTQIHHISPIKKGEVVWHLDPWQVARIGHLFLHQQIDFTKRIPLCGSEIHTPQYLEIREGASIGKAILETARQKHIRIISGNVLTGNKIAPEGFVGFYDRQVTVISEGGQRELLGWLLPGFKKWSFSHTFLSFLFPQKEYKPNTSLQGGRRTLMMNDVYEHVFPFDILPVELFKACRIKDTELMEKLGLYEITPEDVALCELICPSKIEWQQVIREGLEQLYKER